MPKYWMISDRNAGGAGTERNANGPAYFVSDSKRNLHDIGNWDRIPFSQFRKAITEACETFPDLPQDQQEEEKHLALCVHGYNNGFASYSPDGTRLIYRTAGPDGEGLRIMNLADRSVSVLTDQYDNFPLWSPRGDLIAFVRNIAGDFEVMTVHPDGKQLTQLTHTRGNEAHLAWSPDGARLLFTSSRMGFKDETLYTGSPQPYGEIFAMREDGSGVRQLTDNQWEDATAAWLPRIRVESSAARPTAGR